MNIGIRRISPQKNYILLYQATLRTWNLHSRIKRRQNKAYKNEYWMPARSINSRYDLPSFTRAVLNELAILLVSKKASL